MNDAARTRPKSPVMIGGDYMARIASAARAFVQELLHLLDVVGKPSLNRLEGLSRKLHPTDPGHKVLEIKRSTLDDYLRGKRRKVPDWPLVRELLMVCRRIAEEDGFP